ncbi:MAG: amidohydrolase, partial [Gemmatimonadales bacterium]
MKFQNVIGRAAALCVAFSIALGSCATNMKQQDVTLAIVNAHVWTANPKQPWASGIAVAGDSIISVGSSAEIAKLAKASPNARVIDAKGGFVAPGFIDSHVHFITGGFRLASVQLRDAKTPQEFAARIKAFAATVAPGTWITGGDWDHQQWGGELPTRAWIDSVTPNNPVWVSRLDGHMALANGLALAAGKVTKATADIEGGTIVRDAAGNPTGILKDNAQSYVDNVEPPASDEMNDRALAAAMKYVAERGVTSVHNMGDFVGLAAIERAHLARSLITRIYQVTPISQWERLRDTVAKRGKGDNWVRIGGLKGFVDGSLGSHTAAMFAPFTDSPKDSGFFVNTEADLYQWTSEGDKAGLQIIVHAIGDRAINRQLDIFERVAKENGAKDRRFRIEHAQHIAPGDIPRFAALGVIPSMQPYHAIDDGRWAEKVIGPERA